MALGCQRFESFTEVNWPRVASRSMGLLMGVMSATSLLHLYLIHFNAGLPYESGGILGDAMGNVLLQWFNRAGATIVFLPILLIGITLLTGTSWLELIEGLGAGIMRAGRYCCGEMKINMALPKPSF
ncbi:MAG: DNA translocase FtsK 4TM domain-containing protein [Gammaproteobacteria bacterium]|nr:DNA translocase FtsK 4TM domain-containing protein [Gammaproteobacteria bacterium]